MKYKAQFIIASSILAMGILFMVGIKLYDKDQRAQIGFLAQENSKIFAPDHSMKKGDTSASIVVTEFFDPECESCRMFYPEMESILKDYEGKIQLVLRYAPFHGNSIMMVKILEASRLQNKYWETLEKLYEHQPEWGNHHHPQPELVWYFFPEIALDVDQLKKDMENPEIQNIILQDQRDGQSLNVRKTPTFFVNGKHVMNFGAEYLRQAIEDEINTLN